MEITINETNRTIKLGESIKLSELYDLIKRFNLNPDEYTIIGTEKVIEYFPYQPCYPPYPDTYPIICYASSQGPSSSIT